ncbi:MAG: hypothetical protein CMJ72_06265 [Planctomycetaceae bacterium]|nr:hypothetical protein [Planctomycetaceae bacterium]HCK42594.1 hypothetical protein [Planctomycetaceae bacterium]
MTHVPGTAAPRELTILCLGIDFCTTQLLAIKTLALISPRSQQAQDHNYNPKIQVIRKDSRHALFVPMEGNLRIEIPVRKSSEGISHAECKRAIVAELWRKKTGL